MPLAFDSISHGTIAFGFFNIDSDMLLLEHYFFFASEFCAHISHIARSEEKEGHRSSWEGYYIARQRDIGDLTGAIYGVQFTGFIGETYRLFPFPNDPRDFKQKTEGYKNRGIFQDLIERFAKATEIPLVVKKEGLQVEIGEFRFTRDSFHGLLKYVWRGGMPGWKDEKRPPYVLAMKEAVEHSERKVFQGLVFDA